MLDRLALTPARLKAIADDVRQVCNLADPVGQVIDGGLLDSGLRLERRRVPLGVIGVIYEARPNVTVDVASLCLKTGNAAILRGGKETYRTNAATVAVIQKALEACGLPAAAVQSIDNPDRALVAEMLRMDKYIDMLILAVARVCISCAVSSRLSRSSPAALGFVIFMLMIARRSTRR